MHRHLKPHQWALAFGDPNDQHGWQLFGCPQCAAARGDLKTWILSVAECARCTLAFEAFQPIPSDAMDCESCLAAYAEFEKWLDRCEHFEPLIAPEWEKAADLLAGFADWPVEAQIARIETDTSYHQWGLCQRLLEQSRDLWLSDPLRAHERARVGALVADRLQEEDYHPLWVADLRAKAHAYLANSYRLLGQFPSAEQEFAEAERWVERGVGQGRAETTVLSLRASLLLDQYRHLEAEALLDRVERHLREYEQHRDLGRILLKRAMVSGARGLPKQAAGRLDEALTLLDSDEDSALCFVARNNLVHYRIESGDLTAAREAFEALPRPEARLLGIRRTWLGARLLTAEGELESAASLYDDVRISYLAEELHYNVALVSLDLAIVAGMRGEDDTVRELARDALVLLTRAGAPQEAFAAIRLLVDAVERQAVSVAFIQQVARKLSRVQPSQ